MKTFLNDSDGMSARDYLLLLSTTVFFAFVVVGLVLVLAGIDIDDMYLALLEMVAPVVMTIVAGLFGVQAIETFKKPKEESQQSNDADPPSY